MIEEIISEILIKINEEGVEEIPSIIRYVLSRYNIERKPNELMTIEESWKHELMNFLMRKKTSGKSDRTIKHYAYILTKMLSYMNKRCEEITEADLFAYLCKYKRERGVSDTYLENQRLIFYSFFGWLYKKGITKCNPVGGLEPIKSAKRVKKPFSAYELESIRMATYDERSKALVEVLYSTGMRVSELTALNIDDINFDDLSVVVYGKGKKERETYLSPSACIHLQIYLKERTDNNNALFVSINKPNKRLKASAVEYILKKISKNSGIDGITPHRFRRTFATNMLEKGMPIEEVQALLGHDEISTTMIYCKINQNNVKHDHRKYIGA